jgi:hypothetical protein
MAAPKQPFDMQRLAIVGAVGRAYVAMVRQGKAFLALAWLPWLFGVLVLVVLLALVGWISCLARYRSGSGRPS